MPFFSPGSVATNSINEFVAQQAATKRQAMMDRLAVQRETDYHNQAVAALEEKKAEHAATIKEKERSDTLKDVSNMVRGDIPDPDLVERTKRHHVPLPMAVTTPPAQPVPGIVPSLGGTAPIAPAIPGVLRFAGTQKEKEAEQKKADLQKFIGMLPPGDSERRRLEEEMLTGRTAPTGAYKPTASATERILIADPTRTKFQQLMPDGSVQPFIGTPNKGDRILEQPQPKDTSAREATAEARKEAHRDQVHQTAIAELDKWAKPIEDQIGALNNLGVSLAQVNNPKSDALVAIELLKGTVAGGGVRLTQPEITQVLSGSRTKWDTLQLKLNQWGGDNTQPLVLTDDEKTAVRSLAKALRKKANDQHQKITKSRHAMDDAEDVKTLNSIRTKLQEDLFSSQLDETEPSKRSVTDFLPK